MRSRLRTWTNLVSAFQQNTLKLYPPTTLAVAKARKMKEEDWREAMTIDVTPSEARKMLDILLKNKKQVI